MIYKCWSEDGDEASAKMVEAVSPEVAAERFAEWHDRSYCEFTYAREGGSVFVRPAPYMSEPVEYRVEGEAVPHYYARAVTVSSQQSVIPPS